jgi:hypothetical protein
MKSTTSAKTGEKRRSLGWALLPLLLLAAPATGCIIVEDDVEDDTCFEGDRICDGDYAEECIDDYWVVLEDCYDLCGGTCAYVDDDPACLC